VSKGHKRTINSLGNDNDYALYAQKRVRVFGKGAVRKIRKAVKRQTAKYERREPIQED
jgi:hypothetical protein